MLRRAGGEGVADQLDFSLPGTGYSDDAISRLYPSAFMNGFAGRDRRNACCACAVRCRAAWVLAHVSAEIQCGAKLPVCLDQRTPIALLQITTLRARRPWPPDPSPACSLSPGAPSAALERRVPLQVATIFCPQPSWTAISCEPMPRCAHWMYSPSSRGGLDREAELLRSGHRRRLGTNPSRCGRVPARSRSWSVCCR